MPSWKRIITSGSNAMLNTVTASFYTGSFRGDGSQLTGITATVNTSSLVVTSSFNNFTASINAFTASYNTGSFSGSFTGNLLGTSSWATSASQAVSASYVTGSIFAGNNLARSSSFALTASYALTSAGGGGGFPFTGTASISGALIVTGSSTLNSVFLRGNFSSNEPTLRFGGNAGSSNYPYTFRTDTNNHLVLNVGTGSINRNVMAVTPQANIIWNCEEFVRFSQGPTTLINATPTTVTIDTPVVERQSSLVIKDSTFLGHNLYNETPNASVYGIGNHAEGKNTSAGTSDYITNSFPFYTNTAISFENSSTLQTYSSQSWFAIEGDDKILTNLNVLYDSSNQNSMFIPLLITNYDTLWIDLINYLPGNAIGFALRPSNTDTCTYLNSRNVEVPGNLESKYDAQNVYAIKVSPSDSYKDNYYELITVSRAIYNAGSGTTNLEFSTDLTYESNRVILEGDVDSSPLGISFNPKILLPIQSTINYTNQEKLAIDNANNTGSILFGTFTITSGSTKFYQITEEKAATIDNNTKIYLNSAGYSHVEGLDSTVVGGYSHVAGIGLVGSGSGQTVIGKYNTHQNTGSLFVVGGGTGDADRRDAFSVDQNRININNGFKYSHVRDNVNLGVVDINPSCSIFCVTHGTSTTVRLPDINTIPLGTTYYIKSVGGSKFALTSSNSTVAIDYGSTFWSITGSSNSVAPAVQIAYLPNASTGYLWGILSVWNGVTSSIIA